MKTAAIGILAALACAVIGFIGYGALRYQAAYAAASSQLQAVARAVGTTDLMYGTFRSYDGSGMLTIDALDPYQASSTPLHYSLPLSERAYLGRQQMQSEGDTYARVSSISPLSREELGALTPGTRVKFLVNYLPQGTSVSYLLVGDPL